MKYRAEIDGLRALAVVPVILFHAGFELFSGGFVGVDVFFVISGYLITSILIEDIENKRFSIVNFYERRARRILPALFFVMLVCIPFAWMWMLPNQLTDFSQSLVAVSLFVSNLLFWSQSGYFAAAAEEKPLLHTWSLAVEEQYYILFPIFLILAWRFGKNRVFWMIVVMAAISLLLSEWGWRNKASANFYLAPTRAWELFAGSIAAFIVQKNGVQKNNVFALLGLAGVIFSIFAYDETIPFPSVFTLVPVLGVVLLVIYADKRTIAARILGAKAFVGIGLVSYSAYLWHQPLLAFAKIKLVNPSFNTIIGLVVVTLPLAYLSWLFIETPFRKKDISRNTVLYLSGLGLSSFIVLGILQPKMDKREFDGLDLYFSDSIECSYPTNGFENLSCEKRAPKVGEIIFIGDSLLSSSLDGISLAAKELNVDFSAFPKWACPSLKDTTRVSLNGQDLTCSKFNSEVFDRFLSADKNYKIVLFSAFNRYLSNGKAAKFDSTCKEGSVECVEEFQINLAETINYLRGLGHKVYAIEQPPRYDIVSISNPNEQIFHLSRPPTMSRETHQNDSVRFLSVMKSLGVEVFDFRNVFCDAETCTSVVDGQNYYVNGDHFGAIGAANLQGFWGQLIYSIYFHEDQNE